MYPKSLNKKLNRQKFQIVKFDYIYITDDTNLLFNLSSWLIWFGSILQHFIFHRYRKIFFSLPLDSTKIKFQFTLFGLLASLAKKVSPRRSQLDMRLETFHRVNELQYDQAQLGRWQDFSWVIPTSEFISIIVQRDQNSKKSKFWMSLWGPSPQKFPKFRKI
jgi:hypothetical protein